MYVLVNTHAYPVGEMVIRMTSAEYCHMEDGECIEEIDPRYGGYRSDVRPPLDRWYSGKQEYLHSGDNELKKMNVNCPTFIITYARLLHTCVKGVCSTFAF